MQQMTKRWLSLLLAAVLCVSAGGVPALAAELAEENTSAADEQQAEDTSEPENNGGEEKDDNGITTLPTTGEERPVISVPTEGGDTGDSGNAGENGDNGTVTDPENPENPVNPENPSDNGGQPADDENGKTQDGENGGSAGGETKPAEPAPEPASTALPENFFTSVEFGKGYDESTGVLTRFGEGETISADTPIAMEFHYAIPEGTSLTKDVAYEFEVDAPLAFKVDFDITGEDGKTVVARGTTSKSADGKTKFTLTFLDEAYCEAGSKGYFYVGATFEQSEIGIGGRKDIDIKADGKVITTIHPDFAQAEAKAEVKVRKEGKLDAKNHKVDWTVTVTPNVWAEPESEESKKLLDHINSLVVTDNLVGNKLVDLGENSAFTLDESSLKALTKDGKGENAGTFEYKDGKLTFTGNEEALKKTSWPIKLTFTTKFDPDNANFLSSPNKHGDTITFYNEAKAKITAPSLKVDEDGKVVLNEGALKPDEVKANASVSITYASLDKKGKLTTGKTASWSITAKNSLNQKNPRIVDTLPDLMELVDGSLKWKNADGTYTALGADEYSYDKTTNVLTIFLKKNTTKEQTVVYDTKFRDTLTADEQKKLAAMTEVKNNAKLYLGGDDDGTGGTIAKDVTESVHIGQALMQKKGVKYNRVTHTFDWEIVIEPIDGKELHDVILTDEFDQIHNNHKIGQYYVQGSMKMTLDGKEETPDVTFNPADKDADADHKTGFTLTIKDTHHTKRIVITYQTKLADWQEGGQQFWGSNSGFNIKNKLTMSANGLPAKAEIEAQYRGESKMLTKKAGSYNPKTHEISWTMTVNQNKMKVTNGKIVDTLDSADWEFVQNSVTFSNESVKKKIEFSNTEPQTMTIELNELNDEITITYKTKLKDEALKNLVGNNTRLTVNNTAKLTGSEVADNVTASAGKTIGQDVLKKTVKFDGGNIAEWQVDVNRNHATITAPEDTDSIGISDTLQEGLVYVKDSLEVCQVDFDEWGNASHSVKLTEGTDYKVDYNETDRKLSITWPNMREMTESYQVKFETKILLSGTYNNTVKFFGEANGKYDSTVGGQKWRLFSGGSAVLPLGSGMLRIVKTDGTTHKPLEDVTFALKYADSGNTFITGVTDSEGKLEFGPLPAGEWVVEEVATKTGYKIPTVHEWTVNIVSKQWTELKVDNFSEKNVATLTPQVTKAVSGAGALTTDFTFTLTADMAGAPMPAADKQTATVKVNGTTAKNTESTAVAYFGQIQFTKEGDYEYTIQEQTGSADHFTYDTKSYKMYVHVAYDASGQLTATAAYGESKADSLTITNKYQRYVKYAPAVTKQVDVVKGPNPENADEEFVFTLENAAKTYTDTAKAKAGATAQFREIEFTEPGTYEFTITETEGITPYMTYDTTAHKLVVTVTENTDGTLAASAKYDGADSLTVTNKYHEFVEYAPEVTKKIDGNNVPKDKTFTFELKADPKTADAPLPEKDKQTASVKDEGTAKFGAIEFNKAGTYKYIITEKNGGERGFTYDTAEHKLTVTVTKGTDGKLSLTAKYDDDKDSLTITNKYKKPSSGGGGGTVKPDPTPDPKPDPEPDKPVDPTDPDKPTDPDQPSTPDKPSQPDKPTPPHYPIDKVPDPNEPDAPDPIIIDDEDIPKGEFHIKENPDGTFEYVDEDDVPLSEWIEKLEEIKDEDVPTASAQPEQPSRGPKTGTPLSIPMMLLIALVCATGAAALTLFEKKKFK